MRYKKLNKKIVLLTCILLNLVLLISYFQNKGLHYFNSDVASNILFAKEVWTHRSFLIHDWIYNNRDIFILNYELIVVLLSNVLPVGLKIHIYASAIYASIFLWISYLCIKSISQSSNLALLVTAFLATGITSPFVTQIIYDWGGSYGAWLLACLAMYALTNHWLRNIKHCTFLVSYKFFLNLFILVLITSISSPSRSLLYLIAPFVLTITIYFCIGLKEDNQRYIKILLPAITILIALAIGYATNKTFTYGGSILESPSIYDLSSIAEHFSMILKSALYLFGFPSENSTLNHLYLSKYGLKSLPGLYLIFTIILAFLWLVLPILFYKRIRLLSIEFNWGLLFPGIAFAMALLIHVVAFRYPIPNDYTSIRYVFPSYMLIFVAFSMYYKDSIQNIFNLPAHKFVLIPVFLLVTGYMNYIFPFGLKKEWVHPDEIMVQCLENNNLKFGYADYWDASSITVMSNSEIIIRPVVFEQNKLQPYPILVSRSWYTAPAHSTIFMTLSKDQEKIYLNQEKSILTGFIKKIECNNKSIYVFDNTNNDIFPRLFN